MENNLDVLQGLHTLLAEYFKRELEASMGEDGFPIPSATLGVIVTFLKNNNITADIKDDADIEELRAKITKRKAKSKDERASNLIEVADSVGEAMGFSPEHIM